MTAPVLLAWITAALLVQITLGAGFALWRRGRAVASAPAQEAAEALPPATGAWAGWRAFRVARRVLEDPQGTQCSFHLEPVDGVALLPFKPGQFLTFQLQVNDPAASTPGGTRTLTRCYSLSDGPDPAGFRVTIKRVPAPSGQPDLPAGASSGHFHDQVQEGSVLQVRAPSGHFFIDPDPAVPAVLIGGGIGITPMMSMLRWCLAEQPGRTLHLYYGLRNSGEQAFKQTLEALAAAHPNFHLNVVYSRPGPDDVAGRDYQHTGHVEVDLLRRTLPHGRHQFYVCGPPPMMETLVPSLARWGVAAQDIHHEAFGPASVRSAQAVAKSVQVHLEAPVEVRFQRSGRTLVWDGQDANLLDFAERHGVNVDSGCRSGGCGSCQTRLRSGTVHYAEKPDHDVAPGHCLLCVGTPASALVMEA